MSWLSEWLKRIGVLEPYTHDEVINAEQDNALYDLEKTKERAGSEFDKLSEKSERLRGIMSDARLHVAAFAQFEQRIKDLAKLRRPH